VKANCPVLRWVEVSALSVDLEKWIEEQKITRKNNEDYNE